MKSVKLLLATAAGLALAGAVTTSALAAPAVRVPTPGGPDGTTADLASASAAAAMLRSPRAITGTWVVTVTPNAPIPRFESTLSFLPGGEVIEVTSKGPMSGGLGVWRAVPGQRVITTFHKYRFDSAGNYIGQTTVREVESLRNDAEQYIGQATTTLTNPSGAVVSSFSSVSAGVRMPR